MGSFCGFYFENKTEMKNESQNTLTLDLESGRLLKKNTDLKLTPKIFRLLEFFVKRPNSLVTTKDILEYLWPDTFVTSGLVREYVNDLRHVLNDNPKDPSFIETVHGRGYRYIGDLKIRVTGDESYDYGIPTIAVLPFKNLTGNQKEECFCDGLTENIITHLSHFRDLLVISSSSSFVYKDKKMTLQGISHELNVRFILEGSVQIAADQIRISAQLIDAQTGIHLWTHNYDRHLENMLIIQDEVSELIVGTLASAYGGRLRKAWQKYEKVIKPVNAQAFDYFMKGIDCVDNFTRQDNQRGREYFIKAIQVDQSYSKAYAGIACSYLLDAIEAWNDNYNACLDKSLEFTKKAIEFDDNESWAYWQLAVYYIYTLQHDLAMQEFEKAIELNPNDADVLADAGYYYSYCGEADTGIEFAQKAMRLNPHYPEYYLIQLAQIFFDARQYQNAIKTYRKSHRTHTTLSNLYLAASYAALSYSEKSKMAIDQAIQLDKQATIKKWTNFRLSPYKNHEDLDHFRYHLELAGLK